MPALPIDKTGENCPTCGSPSPHQHPAMQFEGEVQPCHDPWHRSMRLGVEAWDRLPSSLRYVAPGAERDAMERAKREAMDRATASEREELFDRIAVVLTKIKAICDEPLDERRGHGPTREGQFARIDSLLRDFPKLPPLPSAGR